MTLSLPPQKMDSIQVVTSAPTPGHGRMDDHPDEAEFTFMADAFRDLGGVRTADDIAADLRAVCRGDVGQVARWIVNRQVLNVCWRGNYWIPDFQFFPPSMLLKPAVSAVLRELAPVLNDWELCEWFAAPCEWLGHLSPARALGSVPAEVFHAARAHRFVLAG